MIDIKPFQQTLEKLKQEGKYRVFNDILRERGKFPKAIWYGKYAIKEIVTGAQMITSEWARTK